MPPKIFTVEQEREIAALYSSGKHILEISKAYKVSFPTIRAAIVNQRVPIRSLSDQKRTHELDTTIFDQIDNEQSAYWYGFLWADGGVHGTRTMLGLKESDIPHVEKFKGFLKTTNRVKIIPKTLNGKVFLRGQLGINSRHIADRLKGLGIVPKREADVNPFNQIPENLWQHWIRGLFDGDGSARKDGSIAICGTEFILTQVLNVLVKYAFINPNLSILKSNHSTIYNLYIGGRYPPIRVAKYIYQDATIWLPRKKLVIDSWGPTGIIRSQRNGVKTITHS